MEEIFDCWDLPLSVGNSPLAGTTLPRDRKGKVSVGRRLLSVYTAHESTTFSRRQAPQGMDPAC